MYHYPIGRTLSRYSSPEEEKKKKRKTTINKITTQYEQGSPSVTQIENYKFTYGTIWR